MYSECPLLGGKPHINLCLPKFGSMWLTYIALFSGSPISVGWASMLVWAQVWAVDGDACAVCSNKKKG